MNKGDLVADLNSISPQHKNSPEALASGLESRGGPLPTAASPLFGATVARIVFPFDMNQRDRVTIAFIRAVVESKASRPRVIGLLKTSDLVTLRDRANGMRDIVEFVDDRVTDRCQANDHRQDANRHHENQLCGNNKTSLVVQKCIQSVVRQQCPLASVREPQM